MVSEEGLKIYNFNYRYITKVKKGNFQGIL
jgi:hypothetical protein